MGDLKAIKKILAGAALLAVFALAAGCGSSGDPTTGGPSGDPAGAATKEGAHDKSAHDPCTPRREEGEVEDPPRRSAEGRPVPIEVGKTKLTLEVERTALPGSIPLRFTERPPFEARKGAMLVAVTYRLANAGPDPVEPAEHLNAQLLLRARGALYPYAAELPCGIPITASWALEEGGVNPAQAVDPGGEARTAIVFIVPEQQPGTRLSLVVPEQVGIALRPAA